MAYNIMEVDGVTPEGGRFPVSVQSTVHDLGGSQHIGQLVDAQIPTFIMRDSEHQADPHTMLIDGRDVSVDGAKLDTIEQGAEVNNLSDQQAASLTSGSHSSWHHHDDWYYRKSELSLPEQSVVNWLNLVGVPTEFNPTTHTHDDRYYTEDEIDAILLNYSPIIHNHNDLYYTENETNILLNNKSDVGHIHDDRYYTESEIDAIIAGLGIGPHTHDDRYYTETEIDTMLINYYTQIQVDSLLANKSDIGHTHDDRYFTESEVNTLLSNYSLTTHNHNTDYYTQVQVDGFLADKSDISHDHDNRYFTESEVTTNYYDKTEVDTIIAGLSAYGIKGAVNTFAELPVTEEEGAIYIVRNSVDTNLEGFYRWNSTAWVFLSRNVGDNGITNHNLLSDLNTGDYIHLTALEYSGLTGGTTTTLHDHNSQYYTETEINSFLANKSDVTHTHSDLYYDKPYIDNLISLYSPLTHTHDDRYYTESEIDTVLTNYSLTTHTHDDRYYTESEIDAIIAGLGIGPHTHDDRYYTETEIDSFLANKSDVTHTHDDRYFTELEITSNYYSKTQLNTGQLDNRYYTETETNNLLANKADINHDHNNLYYTQSYIDQLASTYSLIGHTHHDLYYQKVEIDGLLSSKSDVSHIHDNRYFTEAELQSNSGISGAALIGVSYIGGLTSNNVQDALLELSQSTGGGSSSLDGAYNIGRTIVADAGPVKIDSTSNTYAPIELTNRITPPTTGLSGGQMAIIDNDLYIFDLGRNKWLTPSKVVTLGKSGPVDGHLLYITGGSSNDASGYKMPKNGTITTFSFHSIKPISNKDIFIRLNGTIVHTSISDVNGDVVDVGLNLDFTAGEILSVQVSSAGSNMKDVSAMVEFKWRV